MDTRQDSSDGSRPPGSRGDHRPSLAAPPTDLVRFVCIDAQHQEIGRTQPDGTGHLTVRDGAWAYCAAGRYTEPHVWAEIAERTLASIKHSDPVDAL